MNEIHFRRRIRKQRETGNAKYLFESTASQTSLLFSTTILPTLLPLFLYVVVVVVDAVVEKVKPLTQDSIKVKDRVGGTDKRVSFAKRGAYTIIVGNAC